MEELEPPTASPIRVGTQRRLGHPPGLTVLFFAEMWERFSFYGMRSLLTLYLTRVLRYSDSAAYGVYGAYGALVYTFPLVGGLLADRLLGYRVAILLGAMLMSLGHFVMAIPHDLALYLALALLCIGNGFFKPNISSLVGTLYPAGDPRRDAGFTVFYMGINVGAFFAPLVCGTLGPRVSWHLGFSLAGVGMLIGMVWFVVGRARLEGHGEPPNAERLTRPVVAGFTPLALTVLGALICLPLVAWALRHNDSIGYLLYAMGIVVYGGLVLEALRSEPAARGRLLVAMLLMACSMVFWALFEQAGSSLTLFTSRNVDRVVLGYELPAPVFLAANSFYVMVLALPIAALWTALKRRQRDPSVPLKFSLGMVQLGAGYLVLIVGTRLATSSGFVDTSWLLAMYLLHTTGELCLSPIGLSAMTKLAPRHLSGTVMGAWFLATAYSQHIGGLIAKLTAVTHVAQPASRLASLATYATVFQRLGYVAIAVGVGIAMISPWIKRPIAAVD